MQGMPELFLLDHISECVIQNPNARGLAIIITNDYEGSQSPLPQTAKDGDNLLKTLVHSKFIVLWLHNVNEREISDMMNEVKSLEGQTTRHFIQNYECILFAFSGHGWSNKWVVMDDHQSVNIENEVLKPLLPRSIPKFGEVPKVILVDACRGRLRTDTVSTKSMSDVFTKETVPAEGNYLLACATMPEHYSYLYSHGSAWMQEVASQLQSNTNSIENVLVNVNKKLKERANNHEISFQQPDMYVTLSREVHIYGGSTESVDNDKRVRSEL